MLSKIRQICVPNRILVHTLKHLRGAGSKGSECVVYWTGKLVDKDKLVLIECLRPSQTSTHSWFRVDPLTLAEIFVKLDKQGSLLVAAIHSHPSGAFHSFTDDRHPAIHEKGLISIVVPNFGFIEEEDFMEESAFYQYEGLRQWRKLGESEISQCFKLLNKNFEEERLSRVGRLMDSLQLSKTSALSALKSAKVAITIGEELLETQRGKLLLFSLVNMLTRYSITASVHLPADLEIGLTIPSVGAAKVSDGLREHYLKITTSDKLEINPKRTRKNDLAIVIGDAKKPNASHVIFAEASGWNLYLGNKCKLVFSRDSQNPIGPNLCAAFASIEAIKCILNLHVDADFPLLENLFFSGLNYSFDGEFQEVSIGYPVNLRKTALIGLGAVNMAFVYGLISIPSMKGELAAIDPEKIETPNLGTYPTATIFDIDSPKVEVTKNMLLHKIREHAINI